MKGSLTVRSFSLFQTKSQGNDSLKEDLAQTAVSSQKLIILLFYLTL